jgi:3-hydroxyisobutyrate dehydrogenase-like beta-hydroxyacid dehydrogenase
VLGLGSMGTAVVKCLAKDMTVHAWNRGVEKREAVKDVATVTETAEAAVQASNLTLILIDDWEGSVKLIKDIDKQVWKDRTVVLFSTYTPTDIQKLQTDFFDGSSTLVGGAIVGVPQTICSEKALILTSADVPALSTVGRTVAFTGDVGLAALANVALILVITFGVAGQELAHLIMQQYGVDQQFVETYAPLSAEIGPDYTRMLLPMVSRSVTTKEYERSYVPVGVFRHVLQMHASFMDDLGIADDTFLAAYLRYLEKVPNSKFGPAAWVEQAVLRRVNEDVSNENEL